MDGLRQRSHECVSHQCASFFQRDGTSPGDTALVNLLCPLAICIFLKVTC